MVYSDTVFADWFDAYAYSGAAVAVNVAAGPVTVPKAALIEVVPTPAAVASPLEPLALLIEAIVVSDDAHVTDAVRFCVELSVYVPVAVNCCVVLSVMLGLIGDIAIDTSVAAVTVNPVEPEIVPIVAVIVVVP
jgi:hypothetical protein